MLDEQGSQNFAQQMHEFWIQPELDRRFGETGIPANFQIRQCLVKLPKKQPPVVQFNDEVGWEIEHPQLAPGIEMEVGKHILLHEFVKIGRVLPPSIEGQQVAFVYLFWDGFTYQCYFDFTPNWSDYDPSAFDGSVIADFLQKSIVERVVQWSRQMEDALQTIGLWTVTCLLPYPLSKIVERVGEGKLDEAELVLTNHCNPVFIENLVETWKPIEVFNVRMPIFREAVWAHSNGKFHPSIYTLVPQIEGVITDWLYPIVKPTIPVTEWKAKTRIEQFEAEMDKVPQLLFSYRNALASVTEFLKHGQPLQSFKNWLDIIDPSFPSRHPLAHGKYVPEIFTEVNSIKLFLLLDTICQFMMFYEARVLGRNLTDKDEDDISN
jgi:hypothetical protein